jgi:hypothetical protein
MKVTNFLQQVSDEQGPIQSVTAETLEHMSAPEFNELMTDLHGLLAKGGDFHPTNRPDEAQEGCPFDEKLK